MTSITLKSYTWATRYSGTIGNLGAASSSFKSVREINHNSDIQVAVAELTTASDIKLLIASCYRLPNEDKTWLERFSNFLGGVCTNRRNIILAGDFSLPHIPWKLSETAAEIIETGFMELLHNYFLVQLNNTATRKDNPWPRYYEHP